MSAFSARLDELTAARFGTVAALHRALTNPGLTGHIGVTYEAVRGWVTGRTVPEREHVRVLDDVFDADGELIRLAGYAADDLHAERLARLEDEVAALRSELSEAVALIKRILDTP